MVSREQNFRDGAAFPLPWSSVLWVLQQSSLETVVGHGAWVSRHAGQQTNDRVDNRQRGGFAAGQHEIAETDLLYRPGFEQPFVDPFEAAAQQHHAHAFRQRPRQRLIEGTAARTEIEYRRLGPPRPRKFRRPIWQGRRPEEPFPDRHRTGCRRPSGVYRPRTPECPQFRGAKSPFSAPHPPGTRRADRETSWGTASIPMPSTARPYLVSRPRRVSAMLARSRSSPAGARSILLAIAVVQQSRRGDQDDVTLVHIDLRNGFARKWRDERRPVRTLDFQHVTGAEVM